jgi:hypothetical protein
MSEQEFALDAAGNSVHVLVLDEPYGAWVAINRSSIGGIPSREALRAGQAFALQDGSTLRVQLVGNQLQVFRNGQRLSPNHFAVPPQQPYDQPQAYYEYAAPPQVPYGAFPYQQTGYVAPPQVPYGASSYQQPGYSYGVPPQGPYGAFRSPQPSGYGPPQAPYGFGIPPQGPYSAFPYQQPGYVYGTPPVQAAHLPLGEAIRQLPGQYIKVAFTKRSSATFAEEQNKASWGSVWFQLSFYALVFVIVMCVDELITNTADIVPDLIVIIFLSIVVIPMIFFLTTGIYYLIARASGGKGTFLAQMYTMLLFTVPLGILAVLLGLFPVFGGLANRALDGYLTILSVRMMMGVHRLSAGRAMAVILIPVAVILIIAFFIGFAVRPA